MSEALFGLIYSWAVDCGVFFSPAACPNWFVIKDHGAFKSLWYSKSNLYSHSPVQPSIMRIFLTNQSACLIKISLNFSDFVSR